MNLFVKKLISTVMIMATVVGVSATAWADEKQSIKVQVNGNILEMNDSVPTLKGGSVFIPMRAIFESLGAEVAYDEATSTVTATRGTEKIEYVIGGKEFIVDKNGKTNIVTTNTPSYVENGTTFVPVRVIAEVFGATVNWDNDTQTVVIVDTAKLDTVKPVVSKDLSDEEYAAKITEIYKAIQTDSMAAMEGVDQTDRVESTKALRAMVKKIKPYYYELATLTTNGKYKEAQEQISTGALASIKILDISIELINISENADNLDDLKIQEKAEMLMEQITELTNDMQLLSTGITTVIGEME